MPRAWTTSSSGESSSGPVPGNGSAAKLDADNKTATIHGRIARRARVPIDINVEITVYTSSGML